MKRISKILAAFFLCMMIVVPVSAEEHPSRVVDEADLLTNDEELELKNTLNEISERQQFDLAVVTVESMDGRSAQNFADDYYDNHGYGRGPDYDGALLVISMEEREWYITTCGYGIYAIDDYAIDCISEEMVGYLSEGDYAEAFEIFAEYCDDFISNEYDGSEDYDDYYYHDEPAYRESQKETSVLWMLGLVAVCLVGGFIVAFLPMQAMVRQMKNVTLKAEATDYMKPGSRNITVSRDAFLYHNISKVPKPKPQPNNGGGGSHSHMSSGGHSHGGGGGRF